MEEKKLKPGTSEYWMDWYWNRGGREKVQARRYIREYERYKKKKRGQIVTPAVENKWSLWILCEGAIA